MADVAEEGDRQAGRHNQVCKRLCLASLAFHMLTLSDCVRKVICIPEHSENIDPCMRDGRNGFLLASLYASEGCISVVVNDVFNDMQ